MYKFFYVFQAALPPETHKIPLLSSIEIIKC